MFPRRTSYTPTDGLAFVGDPPLIPRYAVDEIHVSVTFSWDKPEGERLSESWQEQYPEARVLLGGPAYGSPSSEFVPGRYVVEGVVFTSRGCDNRCPWCLVPEREGRLSLLPVAEGYKVNDNNFLACPKAHREAVYAMLRRQRKAAVFAGGIDARLVTAEFADELRTIRVSELFLACDSKGAIPQLERAASHLGWLGIEKLRAFVLVGFGGESLEDAERRLEAVWAAGVMPFVQYYRPSDAPTRPAVAREWRDLVHRWSRPAVVKARHKIQDD